MRIQAAMYKLAVIESLSATPTAAPKTRSSGSATVLQSDEPQCGMLYANQVLKKDSGVVDVLGHARELGKTGIGPFSRVKRVASYDFSPRRSRELHGGFVHIVVGGRIVTNPGTDSQ